MSEAGIEIFSLGYGKLELIYLILDRVCHIIIISCKLTNLILRAGFKPCIVISVSKSDTGLVKLLYRPCYAKGKHQTEYRSKNQHNDKYIPTGLLEIVHLAKHLANIISGGHDPGVIPCSKVTPHSHDTFTTIIFFDDILDISGVNSLLSLLNIYVHIKAVAGLSCNIFNVPWSEAGVLAG